MGLSRRSRVRAVGRQPCSDRAKAPFAADLLPGSARPGPCGPLHGHYPDGYLAGAADNRVPALRPQATRRSASTQPSFAATLCT